MSYKPIIITINVFWSSDMHVVDPANWVDQQLSKSPTGVCRIQEHFRGRNGQIQQLLRRRKRAGITASHQFKQGSCYLHFWTTFSYLQVLEGVCSGSDGDSYPNTDGEQWRLTGLSQALHTLHLTSDLIILCFLLMLLFFLNLTVLGRGEGEDTHRAEEQRHNTWLNYTFFLSWVVGRSPDTIPRVNSSEKTWSSFILTPDFSQTLTSLKQGSCFLPNIPKLITHPRLSSSQSANAEWTPPAPEQQMQNTPIVFPQPLECSHQSSWSLSPGCELYIPEHGMFIQHARYLLGALCVQLDNVASQMMFSFSLSLSGKNKKAEITKPIKPV